MITYDVVSNMHRFFSNILTPPGIILSALVTYTKIKYGKCK